MHSLQRQTVFLEPLIHNPLLEGYRWRTPHLRSPTERALSMADITWMGSHFPSYRHREFILFSILPVLAATLARRRSGLWKKGTRMNTDLHRSKPHLCSSA